MGHVQQRVCDAREPRSDYMQPEHQVVVRRHTAGYAGACKQACIGSFRLLEEDEEHGVPRGVPRPSPGGAARQVAT